MDIVVGDGVGGQLRQLRIGLDDRSDRVARTDFLELNENMSSVREAVGLTQRIRRAREDGLGLGDRGSGFREPVGKIGCAKVFNVRQDFQQAEQKSRSGPPCAGSLRRIVRESSNAGPR